MSKQISKYIILKGKIEKVLWITFFYVMFSIFTFYTGYSTVTEFDIPLNPTLVLDYFIGAVVTGISAGLIGGLLMVFYWERWLREKSYRNSLLSILLSFTALYFIVGIISKITFLMNQFEIDIVSAFTTAVSGIGGLDELISYIKWLFIVAVTIIALLVNDKYGPGVFKSFLLGRYFDPKKEERIFMFLDLKGSTTIAEQLGEERYFNFIKAVFKDSTMSILNSGGEIYQYVGDEIVVSWKMKAGTTNANCITCFFEIQESLRKNGKYYTETFDGIVPKFKAGLHHGSVMVGEVGIVKRDIAFSGDVLNTAARIQSKCNEYKVNLLFSEHLLNALKEVPSNLVPKKIGKVNLRGKENDVMLFTI